VEGRDRSLATTAFMKEDREGRVFVDSTRAGGATVVAAYSPRVRPGVPVSFPIDWSELDQVVPSDFTLHTAAQRLEGRPAWVERMPVPQTLPADIVEEGHEIPIARVQAMHEGKRRRREAK
jgi:DNA primase